MLHKHGSVGQKKIG